MVPCGCNEGATDGMFPPCPKFLRFWAQTQSAARRWKPHAEPEIPAKPARNSASHPLLHRLHEALWRRHIDEDRSESTAHHVVRVATCPVLTVRLGPR